MFQFSREHSRERIRQPPLKDTVVGPEEVSTVAHERDESAEAPDVGREGVALELVENLRCHVDRSTCYESNVF